MFTSNMAAAWQLEQKQGGRWPGSIPLLAGSELEAGSRMIYRNVAFNTYGKFLSTTEKREQAIEQVPNAVIGL